MDQEREDYADGDVPVEQVIPAWLHVPIAFVVLSCGVFALAVAIGAVFK